MSHCKILLLSAVILLNCAFNNVDAAGYCTFPTATKQVTVSAPITVSGTMDFNNSRLTATSALRSSCSISGSVNGQHIITIADGGTIKNVILADPAKGIWCEGSCTLQNVYFEKTCYHGAGFAGGSGKQHKVIGGAGMNALDKFFTQSSQGTTTIQNWCGENFGKIYASCGSGCTQVQRNVVLSNVKAKGPALTLISVNPNYKDTMSFSGVTIDGQKTGAAIKYACQEYNAVTGQVSTLSPINSFPPGVAGTGASCKYAASAIKINS